MRSQQLVDIFKALVQADIVSQGSILNFYMTHNFQGGWEGWLQTVYARAVFAALPATDFNREVAYTGSALRSDLWFAAGTNIWVELKTQRNGAYNGTANDFQVDVGKIMSLSADFRRTDVVVALAVFKLSDPDRTALNEFRNLGPSGTVSYCTFTGRGWQDVTEKILEAPVGEFMIAAYRAA